MHGSCFTLVYSHYYCKQPYKECSKPCGPQQHRKKLVELSRKLRTAKLSTPVLRTIVRKLQTHYLFRVRETFFDQRWMYLLADLLRWLYWLQVLLE